MRTLDRGVRLVQACLDGFWLGLLDRDLLHAVDEIYYNRESSYTDKDYNRRGLWDWEKAALESHFAGRRRICVAGAGAGREILALVKEGYDAFGFDCNAKLVEFGDKLLASDGYEGRLLLAARDQWPETISVCDAVIVGWGSYMLIGGRQSRIEFLRRARAALPVGAPILISFFPRTRHPTYFRVVLSIGNLVRRARRRAPLEMGDALAPNFVHFFTEQQIEEELREGGFELLAYRTREYGHAVGVSAES